MTENYRKGAATESVPRGSSLNPMFSDDEKADSPYKPLKSAKTVKLLKVGGVVGVVVGLVFLFVSAAVHADEEEDDDMSFRFWGLGMFSIALGWISTSILLFGSSNFAKSSYFRTKMAIIGIVIVGTSIFSINAIAFMLQGAKTVCNKWHPDYDPDYGFCPCDKRKLLTTNVSPFFDVSSEEEFLSRPVVVASIGDIELSTDGRRTMNLMKEKNPDLVIINGDLTYKADPEGLAEVLDIVFGPDFPIMMTVGNHDTGIFTEYQKVFVDRYERYIARNQNEHPLNVLRCEGELGVNQLCSFRNMGFALSGLGSSCSDDEVLNEALESQLQVMESKGLTWRTVFIHKNQRLLQTGGKRDEVGIFAFEQCLEKGAMMMNAHEHQYMRTKELHKVGLKEEDFEFVSDEEQELLNGKEVVKVGRGSFGVVANGLGGKSLRYPKDGLDGNEWWSVVFNIESSGADYGVHVCEYNNEELDPSLAFCYFETVTGKTVDEYFVRSLN